MFKNNKIEEKVMAEIKSGKVKLRSRYVFLAEKLGIGSAFIFSVFLAVLFFTLVLFYLQASDNLGYLSFGSRGMFAFLETFPYLLVATLIICVFIAGFILKKSGVLYQKPFGRLALSLLGFIVFVGVILTFTSLGENIEKRSYNRRAPSRVFHPLLHQSFGERQRGIAGRIVEIGDNFINIETPMGVKKIDFSSLQVSSTTPAFETGMFIMAVGKNKGELFSAVDIKVVNENEMPMIRRGIDDRFGSFEGRKIPLPGEEKVRCFEGCVFDKNNASSCEKNCLIK